ncbi:hypothetical protein ACIA8C_21485 [Nocardia sp. NPDC051321]|uniref:2OG-Fe(II)-dependent halogenase WelO5 family protein n=1 Tax=Nocardia sp. NPDC051321 TaxID=3364323 RepID=UPI0037A11814
MMWNLVRAEKLDAELLKALLDNEIAAVSVPEFLSEQTCRDAVEGIERSGLDYYLNVEPPVGRIGITQYEHRRGEENRRAYLAAAPAANQRRRAVFAQSGDLLELVTDAIAAAWPGTVGLAYEGDQQYFAGLVRVIRKGLLHCDWAPNDAPGWAIGSVDAQITWNVFCQVPESGGVTNVYNRPWDPDAEQSLVPDSYAYDASLVDGCAHVRIEPSPGELVLFNSRNFHSIESSEGVERISVSSFVGRIGSDLVLWS